MNHSHFQHFMSLFTEQVFMIMNVVFYLFVTRGHRHSSNPLVHWIDSNPNPHSNPNPNRNT